MLFGCRNPTGKKWRLGIYRRSGRSFIARGSIKLNGSNYGRYVAFVHVLCFSGDGCGQAIVVRDLKSGATIFDSGSEEQLDTIESLVLKHNGSVAWIAKERGTVSVRKHDSSGQQIIDSSTGPAAIDIGSLALSGNMIYWKKDGEPYSAGLD